MSAADAKLRLIDDCAHTMTVINPYQYEVGQCCVITKRHVATLLALSDEETAAILMAAKRVAHAMLKAFEPLGILTFQNNGIYSGQLAPHYHYHIIPRQLGSNWGIGPPQLAYFEGAGRMAGSADHDLDPVERKQLAQVAPSVLYETASKLRSCLPS